MTDSTDNVRGLDLDRLIWRGFAQGAYYGFCSECGKQHIADKRAWRCLECAEHRADLAPTPQDTRALADAAMRLEKAMTEALNGPDGLPWGLFAHLHELRAALAALSPTGGNADE